MDGLREALARWANAALRWVTKSPYTPTRLALNPVAGEYDGPLKDSLTRPRPTTPSTSNYSVSTTQCRHQRPDARRQCQLATWRTDDTQDLRPSSFALMDTSFALLDMLRRILRITLGELPIDGNENAYCLSDLGSSGPLRSHRRVRAPSLLVHAGTRTF